MLSLVFINLLIGTTIENDRFLSDISGPAKGTCSKIPNCLRVRRATAKCSECEGTFDKVSAFRGDDCTVQCSWRKNYHCWPGVCGHHGNGDAQSCTCGPGLAPSPACDSVRVGGSITGCRIKLLNADGVVKQTAECSGTHFANMNTIGAVKARLSFDGSYTKTSVYDHDLPIYIKRWDVGFVSAEVQTQVFESRDRNCSGSNQAEYRGLVSVTMSGVRCQNWATQYPHRHWFTPEKYQDHGLGNHSYCRNPDGQSSVWCYTEDPDQRWDYCHINTCDTSDEIEYTVHREWEISTVARGICLENGGDLARPRNKHEQNKLQRLIPSDLDTSLTHCDDGSTKYRGTTHRTRFGVDCIEWKLVKGGKYYEHKNYCRRFSSSDESLWCYINTDGSWDYCDIPKCNEEISPDLKRSIYYTLGIVREGNKWTSVEDHRALQYTHWNYQIGYGDVGVVSQSGRWMAASDSDRRPFICQNAVKGILSSTKHSVTCDRRLSTNSPVNGAVRCQADFDIKSMKHNGRLSVRVRLDTGGYRDVVNLENNGYYRTFYNKFTSTRSLTYQQDSNPPVHCSPLHLCSGGLFRSLVSFPFSQQAIRMEGWESLDEDKKIKSYSLQIYKLRKKEGRLVRGSTIYSRVYNKPTPLSISYSNILIVVYLTVTDTSGNSQVSRKLILKVDKEDVHVDKSKKISAVGAFKGYWVTDTSKPLTIQWSGRYYLPHFTRYASHGIDLPLEDGTTVRSEYDDLGGGLFDLSVKGKQHKEGIVLFESQLTQHWEKAPWESKWVPTEDVTESVVFSAHTFYTGNVWVRATGIHGTKAISKFSVFITEKAPELIGLQLESGLSTHDKLELSSVCVAFTALDSVAGVEGVSYRLMLGNSDVTQHEFNTKVCAEEGDNCQCNDDNKCSPKHYSFCLLNANHPKLHLLQGAHYNLELAVVSFAGLKTISKLEFDVDSTPPQGGSVTKSSATHDKDFTRGSSVRFYWTGFYDLESNLESYIISSPNGAGEIRDGKTLKETSYLLSDLKPDTPYTLCVSAVNSAGLISTPVCSMPVIRDVTPPRVKGIKIGDSYTQPGLASDGEQAWYVTSQGARFKVPCSLFGLYKRNLDPYPIIKKPLDYSYCSTPHFTGATLLFSRHIFDITYNMTDEQSGVVRVSVGASMREGSFNYVMSKKILYLGQDRIYHDISWYVPSFYLNFFVRNGVGLESDVSMGPFLINNGEFTYTKEIKCVAPSEGIYCQFDLENVNQNFEFRDPFHSLAVTLETKTQLLMGYRDIEIPRSGSQAFIPASYFSDKLTPNQQTEVTVTLRLRNQLDKNLYITAKNKIIVTATSNKPWVIDGERVLDIDRQSSSRISARWGGFKTNSCQWAVSSDQSTDDVRVWETTDKFDHKISAYMSNLIPNTHYYTMVRCTADAIVEHAVSNGVLFTHAPPVVYRPNIISMFGADLNFLSSSWHAPLLFGGDLTYNLLKEDGSSYTKEVLTDTHTSASSSTLLPVNQPVRFRLGGSDTDGSTTEAVSALYRVDLTEPIFSSSNFYTSDVFKDGINYIIDSSRLRVQISTKDKESSITVRWVSVTNRDVSEAQRGVFSFISPTKGIITGKELRDGAKLDVQGNTCNGAGMCYSKINRGYPHKVDTSPPTVPRIRYVTIVGDDISISIAGVQEVHTSKSYDVTIGSVPYGREYYYQKTMESSVVFSDDKGAGGKSNFWVSVRGVNGAGLKTPWITRQYHTKEKVLAPDSCDVRTCNERVEYPCEWYRECMVSRMSGISIKVEDLHNDKYTSSVALIRVAWQITEMEKPGYYEVTVVDETLSSNTSSSFGIRRGWKVAGRDTEALLTLSEPLSPGTPYVVMVAAHYTDNVIIGRSQNFIPIVLPPSADFTNPITVSFDEDGLPSPVVGDSLYASWPSHFIDVACRVTEYDVSVGRCKGCDDVMSWQHQNTSSLTISLSEFESASHLFINVIGYNEGGLGTISSSERVVRDNDPPIRGFVIVGSCHTRKELLKVSWGGFYDVDSFITHYQVEVLDNYYESTNIKLVNSTHSQFVYINTRSVIWKDLRVRVSAFDLFSNKVSYTSGTIYSDKTPKIKNCGESCDSLSDMIYLVPKTNRTVGGVDMRLEDDKLYLRWISDAFRTTVTVTDLNGGTFFTTTLNHKSTQSIVIPICDKCILTFLLTSQCGSSTTLTSTIVYTKLAPDLKNILVNPGFLEEGNVIKAFSGNVTLTWNLSKMTCKGKLSGKKPMNTIFSDSQIQFTNISNNFNLSLTCRNKGGTASSTVFLIDPGTIPVRVGDIEFSFTPPVLFHVNKGFIPDGAEVVAHWTAYNTTHGPLSYEVIQGASRDSELWHNLTTSTEVLLEHHTDPCTTLFVRALTPGHVTSDVTNRSICVQAPVLIKSEGRLLTEVKEDVVKVSWAGVFKNCLDCKYLASAGCEEHLANIFEGEALNDYVEIPLGSCRPKKEAFIKVVAIQSSGLHARYVQTIRY